MKFLQKFVKRFLLKTKSIRCFESLACFWDKYQKNLITIFINQVDNNFSIINTNDLKLKLKAYSIETQKTFEKNLTNEPFLYKLQRHKRINLKSLKEYMMSLKGK